jgi:hypothetical protein
VNRGEGALLVSEWTVRNRHVSGGIKLLVLGRSPVASQVRFVADGILGLLRKEQCRHRPKESDILGDLVARIQAAQQDRLAFVPHAAGEGGGQGPPAPFASYPLDQPLPHRVDAIFKQLLIDE